MSAWNAENAENYGYYFVVADNSINMDRETMAPMLSNGSAPEILYYLGTTIAEDQSKGWFYDISSAMESPNKYSKSGEAGSVQWKDIYDSTSYASTFAPNGEKYTVSMYSTTVDISGICKKYGGGGHKNVGTCQFGDDNMDEQLPKLIDEIVNYNE